MIKALGITFTLLLTSLSVMAETKNMLDVAIEQFGRVELVEKSPLSGVWALNDFGGQCVEFYNFQDDHKLTIVSGRELSIGQFDYTQLGRSQAAKDILEASKLKAAGWLELDIIDENLQTDCGGKTIDQRNDKWRYLVNEVSANSIQLCLGTTPDSCVMTLNRLLP